MNYGEKLRLEYFKTKNKVNKERREFGLTYDFTLEEKLRDGYTAHKEFWQITNTKPKK